MNKKPKPKVGMMVQYHVPRSGRASEATQWVYVGLSDFQVAAAMIVEVNSNKSLTSAKLHVFYDREGHQQEWLTWADYGTCEGQWSRLEDSK